ncbi:UDP-N-acetylmuramoyl-tripeptide--D-alanyl-D-alanine ligase [Desertivirga xinjiangensis]|uniref:UDP-N-acetylmuramoyl-tripeptide--D-alanyl-D- alanine ligase n=1 Tax=Desertivirga xinjiangensis TaxID=539206 RepID=UPI002109438C|nr:UDP-N-acetylmuramoyl-tripeptide--D-alanyl-D-alanine ligase [Pedobacter xinjiangensis]
MTIEAIYKVYSKFPHVCTDTRKISRECLFFALKGESFDGNKFAEKAIEAGAAYAVIDNAAYQKDDRYILVDDVLVTLQDLARYHRRQLAIPFIGITGTNGKTTTKELLNAVFSQKFKTYATQGNLNNHIGVPLTLLSITHDVEIAIVEMGANHQKEIGFLCSIAEPTHGMITNVGKAHLEGFGGFEGVKKGKGELYDFLKDSGGIAFINAANDHLMGMSLSRQLKDVIYYGGDDSGLVNGRIVENSPLLTVEWRTDAVVRIVKTNLTGAYNLENILAAVSMGLHFGLSAEEINKGIESYQPGNNRSQITRTALNTLVCDYYNANPSSMSVALDNFSGIEAKHKVLIVGDMFELGEESAQEHLAVLEKAFQTDASQRIFIGKQFYENRSGFDALFFETTEEAAEAFKKAPFRDATILIKGSRGMKLEQLVELL